MTDTAAITIAVLLAFFLRFELRAFEVVESSPLTVRSHLVAAVLWLASLLGAVVVNRLFDEDTLFEGGGEVARIARAVVEAVAVFSVFVFLTQSFYVSRSWFSLAAALSLVTLTVDRVLMRRFLSRERARGRRRRPVILLAQSHDHLSSSQVEAVPEFEVVARWDLGALRRHLANDQTESRRRPALLVHAGEFDQEELWKIIIEAGEKGHPVYLHAALRSVRRDRLTVRELAGQTIVKIAPPRLFGNNAVKKRAFDTVVASVLLLLLSPLLLAIAGTILVTSGRPVFYVQERVGAKGNLFRMVKFRTMLANAEAESGPVWAVRDDPRATRVGRFLRRWSLDELPQLVNVLRGDMSIVGPRPERPTFVADFTDQVQWYRFRDRIRPGLTGLAQARGFRGDTSLDLRIESDNWYIEHWSIPLDIKIVLRTVGEIIRGERLG
ncbi:MAG TPA: exopolysaccharide biosynthesis polyprenyl glycosylphosphotransferase [Actinomycetota bacterium]|nr:exopolysaccharide biosynthesis polyprenyl glycosylphosphotransferase [Actinomycetota bacterium]